MRAAARRLRAKLRLPSFETQAPLIKKKLKAKVSQGVGKFRRFTLTRLKEEYVASMQDRRTGECLRCGLCCKLLFECPFLENRPGGMTRCRIHKLRPDNCKFFPIDERDLEERNLLSEQTPCGFRFR